jgi:hypothetical protein
MDNNLQYNNLQYNNLQYNNQQDNYQQDNYNIINNYINFLNQYIETVNSGMDFLHSSNRNIRIMQRNLDYYITNYQQNLNQQNLNQQNLNQQNLNLDNYNDNDNNTQQAEENNYRAISNQNLFEILNNNITIKKYLDIETPLNDSCAITHDTFNPDDDVACLNYCKHIFKHEPLVNWLNQHQTCPICRHNILTGSNIIKYTTSNDEILFLTNTQFRHFLVNSITNSIINNNLDTTSNNSIIFSVIR